MEPRTLTLLDETGDTSIAWTPERDGEIKKLIEKKMREGMTFFIVKPRFGGLVGNALGKKKVKVKNVGQITENKITIKDEDFMQLMRSSPEGKAILDSRHENDNLQVVKKAETADEVAKNHSVGVRAIRAG